MKRIRPRRSSSSRVGSTEPRLVRSLSHCPSTQKIPAGFGTATPVRSPIWYPNPCLAHHHRYRAVMVVVEWPPRSGDIAVSTRQRAGRGRSGGDIELAEDV